LSWISQAAFIITSWMADNIVLKSKLAFIQANMNESFCGARLNNFIV